jgi:hypothetical protein
VESTQEISKKVGQAVFVPIPELDLLKSPTSAVGHAGIYEPDDDDDDIDAADVEVDTITADIPIGVKGGIIVLNVETGIKKFAKDIIAEKKATKEHQHLPYTITGLFVHYFVKGIEEDFNRTFTKTPYSIDRGALRSSTSTYEVAKEKGKRVMSKKDKNELVAKCSYPYYEKDIINGVITEEEASKSMMDAGKKKRELENAGFFISPNKTQGVALFDWKTEILNEWDGDETKLKIYSRHSIIPVIPCLFGKDTNKMDMRYTNKFVNREMNKSILEDMTRFDGKEYFIKKIEGWDDTKKHYAPKSFHIAKINQSGKMKDRWFVVDAIRNTDGKQVLLMWDKRGVDGILE